MYNNDYHNKRSKSVTVSQLPRSLGREPRI